MGEVALSAKLVSTWLASFRAVSAADELMGASTAVFKLASEAFAGATWSVSFQIFS